jgi:hypothetical protein
LRIAFQLNEDRNAQTSHVPDCPGFDCFRSVLASVGSGADDGGGLAKPASGGGGGFSITAPSGGSITANQATPISGNPVTYGSGCTFALIGVNYNPPGTVTIAGMTLNGATASQVSGPLTAITGNGVYSDMWVATPIGSSGNLNITYSGAINNGNFAQVWCVVASTQSLTGAETIIA